MDGNRASSTFPIGITTVHHMVGSRLRALVIAIAVAAPFTLGALAGAGCATGSSSAESESALDPSTRPAPFGSSGSSGASSSGSFVPTGPTLSLSPSESSGGDTFDGGDGEDLFDASPRGFTHAEMQKLVNLECSPCHVGGASGGMSLSGKFTTATLDVPSTEVPSMKRIERGSRAKSYLFHKIAGTHLLVGGSGARMPKSGPPYLSELEIELIGKYIDDL